MTVAALVVAPPDARRESVVDDVVGMVRGVIEARRDPCYGAWQFTDDMRDEMARAVAAHLFLGFKIERQP